jgi:hypothetical protein
MPANGFVPSLARDIKSKTKSLIAKKDDQFYFNLLMRENLGRSQADLYKFVARVEMIVRRRFHEGHPILNYEDLRSECMIKLVELLKVLSLKRTTESVLAVLSDSIENHVTDLRRMHFLTKSRGATTIHIQEIVNAEGECIDFAEPSTDRFMGGSIFGTQEDRDSGEVSSQVLKIARNSLNDEERKVLDMLVLIGSREPKAVSRVLKMKRKDVRRLLNRVAEEVDWAYRSLNEDQAASNPWRRGTPEFYFHNALIWYSRNFRKYLKDGQVLLSHRQLLRKMKGLGCSRPKLKTIKSVCALYDLKRSPNNREDLRDWLGSVVVTYGPDPKKPTVKVPTVQITDPSYFLE